MSTRRARIKAVASLPVRRKNVESGGNSNKVEPIESNEEIKVKESPKSAIEIDNTTAQTIIPQTCDILLNKNESPKLDNVHPPPTTYEPTVHRSPIAVTPKSVDNVSKDKPTPKFLFASPQIRRLQSPDRRSSPLIASLITRQALQHDKDIRQDKSKEVLIHSNIVSDVQDYNPPSVPESITDDAGMDGIIPLHPVKSAPKPLDLLKHEIISENAEVLFDPIVPLPSPSKVRPKLRPVPRLAPLRRNSVQGSASESEDESRRALLSIGQLPTPLRQRHDSHTSHSTMQSMPNRDVSRVRNDSVCSSISQIAVPHTQPPGSPVKEKHYVSKTRRQEISRRMTAMRRRRETVKRDALTMYDLIFYNPTTNPIIPNEDEVNAKALNAAENDKIASEESIATNDQKENSSQEDDELPAPQIKIGPNGEIILDEKSLVIKQTGSDRKVSSVVREGSWVSGGGKYTRSARSLDWSEAETIRFYRALAAVGTDFSLMAPLFPNRNRRDLKVKFKKEEKLNGAQVDKALRSATTWDAMGLQAVFEEERAEATKKEKEDSERMKKQKEEEKLRVRTAKQLNVRQSKAMKALEYPVNPKPQMRDLTADDIIQQALDDKKKRRSARKPGRKPTDLSAQVIRNDSSVNTGITIASQPYCSQYMFLNSQPTTITTPVNIVKKGELKEGFAELQKHSRALPPLKPIRIKSKADAPKTKNTQRMATLTKLEGSSPMKSIKSLPQNVQTGSLVVLTAQDPKDPKKKIMQTYISDANGQLTAIALPPHLLNSVMGYMSNNKQTTSSESPPSRFMFSPSSASSLDSRGSAPISECSPIKRPRLISRTGTDL